MCVNPFYTEYVISLFFSDFYTHKKSIHFVLVEDNSFSTCLTVLEPEETKIKMYEVWIKYNMKVYDARGSLLADWIITAYGKTPTEFMKSDKTALNEALIIAVRDVGAGLSLRFRHVPEIQAWMGQRGKVHQTLVVQP